VWSGRGVGQAAGALSERGHQTNTNKTPVTAMFEHGLPRLKLTFVTAPFLLVAPSLTAVVFACPFHYIFYGISYYTVQLTAQSPNATSRSASVSDASMPHPSFEGSAV
jgi:hypothetical protein